MDIYNKFLLNRKLKMNVEKTKVMRIRKIKRKINTVAEGRTVEQVRNYDELLKLWLHNTRLQ